MNRTFRSLARLLPLLAIPLLVTACDSPTDADDDHPVGVAFFAADGSEAARFVYRGATTGQLRVGRGATARYEVRIVNEGGGLVPIDGTEYGIRNLGIVITDAATVALVPPNEIVLTGGTTARQTSIRFDLMHGNHAEFLVDGVQLVVE